MENINFKPAQVMSFLSLVSEYAIRIPVIQRDYAQGRCSETVNKIREDFVHDLLSYIMDPNNGSHQIDFVYGTIETRDPQPDLFIPIDGQQRLTTLFLLHLYIAGMSGNYATFQDKLKNHFEYFTRKSSTEFCQEIIKHDICNELRALRAQNTVNDEENENKTTISKVIENQGWFFTAWKQDPTVSGMLVVLDEVDKQAKRYDIEQLYKRLYESEKNPIVFQWQPLDGYTRTDDLYIKMNARGLKLTQFEVFKALYEKSIDELSDSKKFCDNIDGDWCDFMWKQKGNETDGAIERVVKLMIALGVARKIDKLDSKETQVKLDKLFARNKHTLQFAYSRYRDLKVFHDLQKQPTKDDKEKEQIILNSIIEAMSIICKATCSPMSSSICIPYCDESEYVNKVLEKEIGELKYDDIVYFYAYIAFRSRYRNSDKEIHEWMRYVYNLLNATIINDSPQLARVIKSIDKIIDSIINDASGVLEWISKNKQVDAFSMNQSYEESVKAQLLLWAKEMDIPNDWPTLIKDTEQDSYLRGQIGFLLLYVNLYTNLTIEAFKARNEEIYNHFLQLSERSRSIFSLFSQEDAKLYTHHLIERALLTKGMYLKSASQERYNFCNRPNDRDYSWRKMLEVSHDGGYNNSLKAMKDLLEDKSFDTKNVEDSLNDIVEAYLSNPNADEWYKPFIEKEYGASLINICRQGFIRKSDKQIILMHESQMNHYHSELQSYLLYLKLIKDFNFIQYCDVRSTEEDSGLYFKLKVSENTILTLYLFYRDRWKLDIYDENLTNRVTNQDDWGKYQETINQLNNKLNVNNVEIDCQDIIDLIDKIETDDIIKKNL